ncbi:MAG: ABC transporter ATP-binding protein [Polyangiaceae bacterium]|nr:ABC transporter ATP-binding protein [Polyangiaceae bacterium]
MIEVKNLYKDYGTVVAVHDVSFEVKAGEVVGFLGPNGAGKSTTLRMLAGFLGATSGEIRINGFDIVEDAMSARKSIGYMPEMCPLYGEMRVGEYLRFRSELKGVPRRDRKSDVDTAMTDARVSHMSETRIQHLSKGYRQRVGLADALIGRPPLLILDEPTAGLDPNQIREVRRLIRGLAGKHTVLVSTHILSEVETTCDRAVIIDKGRTVASGTIDQLRTERRTLGAVLRLHDPVDTLAAVLDSAGGLSSWSQTITTELGVELSANETSPYSRVSVEYAPSPLPTQDVLEQIVKALVASGVGVREATETKASLEDVFAQLTRDTGGGPTESQPATVVDDSEEAST